MSILEYAIEMELSGEKFYNGLAKQNEGTKLYFVFQSLAEDEANHAKAIRDKKESLKINISAEIDPAKYNVFGDSEPMIDNTVPGQVDIYKGALIKEQQSIELYEKLLAQADGGKELFEFLIGQEKAHYKLIEEIIEMVNRPNEWVESAEFGRRVEY